jgi:hypothetical protein
METGAHETKESNEMLKNYETIIVIFGAIIFIVFIVLIINNNY